jgi:hypothetical protein
MEVKMNEDTKKSIFQQIFDLLYNVKYVAVEASIPRYLDDAVDRGLIINYECDDPHQVLIFANNYSLEIYPTYAGLLVDAEAEALRKANLMSEYYEAISIFVNYIDKGKYERSVLLKELERVRKKVEESEGIVKWSIMVHYKDIIEEMNSITNKK